MARSRIISILLSAVVLVFVALVVVRGISAFEERAFEAGKALLVAGAEHAELELESGGSGLPGIAAVFAEDEEVSTQVRALGQLMARAPPGSAAANRLKASISRTSKKLNERLTALRSDERPELQERFDALTIANADGEVLVSDSAHFRIGESVLQGRSGSVPTEESSKTNGEDAAEREDPEDDEKEAAADASSPSAMQTLVEAARQGTSARATLVVGKGAQRSVIWVGSAPIVFKGRLYGVVVLEEKLKSLPQPSGVSAMLLIGGQVRMGQAPAQLDPARLQRSGEPFLLQAKDAPALVPLLGEIPVQPLFVGDGGAGIWAHAFSVPGADDAVGYVLTDVTPLFSELGGFQLMTLALMALAWLVHATLISLSGRQMMAGIEQISDFLGKLHQGMASESRLNERKLPAGLHRLVRLINKTLERSAAAVAPIAGAPSIDDVFKAQGAKADEDLAFEGIASSGNVGVDDEPSDEDASGADLAAVEDFDPFNATGEIAVRRQDDAIDDGYDELGSSDDFVGGGVAPDPLAGQNAPPSDWDEGDSLDALAERSEGAPSEEPAAPATPSPLAGSAVADLLSRNGGSDPVEGAEDAAILDESEAVAERADPLEAHYREVYEQFVAARESCGESTAELTFDRFTVKLDKSREAVMSKHNCSEVRFSVYVKNGKAALKATPAR